MRQTEETMADHHVKERIRGCIWRALPVSIKTSLWFLKIMLPVSFLVMLLSYVEVLPYLSSLASPLFALIGLSGDAALVFVTSIFTNIYTVIALISGMDLTVREGVILATMCLISHGFIVETLVLKKTGSSALRMVVLRVAGSFVAALCLNLLLPEMSGLLRSSVPVAADFPTALLNWLKASLWLCVNIFVVIISLMILQRLLEEFGVLRMLSRIFAPLMRLLGLPASVSFLWIVGNTIGLAYGSAIMMGYAAEGKLNKHDADLLNHHLAISHSQIEDPLLFAVMGLPALWLILPRFVLAVAVVWIRRVEWKVMVVRGDRRWRANNGSNY